MSLTDNMAGPSTYSSQDASRPALDPSPSPAPPAPPTAYSIIVPSNLLILPPAAATLGLVIGMTRGGRLARLRFLAENAHRQPTTYQGWYFYAKTRNYKIFLQAAKSGGRYALALGGATGMYTFLEEYVAYIREEISGDVRPAPQTVEGFRQKVTWRRGGSVWWDGAVAGTALGLAVGLLWRLPRTLVLRCVGFGAVLGGTESTLNIAMDSLGSKIVEQRGDEEVREGVTVPAGGRVNETSTDRPVQPTPVVQPVARELTPQYAHTQLDEPIPMGPTAIDDLFAEGDKPPVTADGDGSWWSSVKSWIPGAGSQ